MRRVEDGSIQSQAKPHPYPPPRFEGKDGEQVSPYSQEQPVQLKAQDHGSASILEDLAGLSFERCRLKIFGIGRGAWQYAASGIDTLSCWLSPRETPQSP